MLDFEQQLLPLLYLLFISQALVFQVEFQPSLKQSRIDWQPEEVVNADLLVLLDFGCFSRLYQKQDRHAAQTSG